MIITKVPRRDVLNIIFDGNSICAGNGVTITQRYANLLLSDAALIPYIASVQANIAVSGQTTANMITRQASFLYPKYESRIARNLVIAMEVRNDLVINGNVTNAISNIKTYCQNCRDQGFDVILINQPPSTGGTPIQGNTQLEIDRQSVRSNILTDFNIATSTSLVFKPASGITYANLVCDVGGDSIMGNVSNCSNLTYYLDGTHPTTTGHSNIAVIIKNAILYYLTLQR